MKNAVAPSELGAVNAAGASPETGDGTRANDSPAALLREFQELCARRDALVRKREVLRARVDEVARTNHELEWEAEMRRAAFDDLPVPAVVTDRLGVIRKANAEATALFGISGGFLRGKPLSVFARGDDVMRMHRAMAVAVERGAAETEATLFVRGEARKRVRFLVASSKNSTLVWTARAA